MRAVLVALAVSVVTLLRSRASLHLEVLALRHQLAVLQGGGRRPRLKPADRLLWAWLSRAWLGWRDALVFVEPSTVISWQRKRFRDHWKRLSRPGTPGRPRIAQEIRDLIRKISRANPSWGSSRIQSELRKLGIDVAKSTVEKYRVHPRREATQDHGPSPVRLSAFAARPAAHRKEFSGRKTGPIMRTHRGVRRTRPTSSGCQGVWFSSSCACFRSSVSKPSSNPE